MFLSKPQAQKAKRGIRKYCCKNPANLDYFQELFVYLEAKDLSYIRRIRLLQSMRFLCNIVEKNLAACNRDDLNRVMATMHQVYKSPRSKETFVKDIKYIWRILFPEKDEKGRPDETLVPYPVRHITARTDKSRQKLRQDKLTWDEFERIVAYFSSDLRMQAYLTVSLESLSRPQELLYVRLKDVELFENYAKIYISEHGKEGVGLLQCIDSFPYLLKWLEVHPFKTDKRAFLFINTRYRNNSRQLRPVNINKMMRSACEQLKIIKPITCYSLKRNGVTIRRLRGETDMEIQHAARWTSTQQLKTYDLSSQDDAFRRELEKRGIIKSSKITADSMKVKTCPFCNETVGFGETICPKCKHILNRDEVLKEKNKDEEILRLRQAISSMDNQFASIKQQIIQELMEKVSSKDSLDSLR